MHFPVRGKRRTRGIKRRMFWIFWRHFTMGDQSSEPTLRMQGDAKTPAAKLPRTSSSRISGIRTSYHSPSDIANMVSRYGREVFCVLDAKLACHYLTENWETVSGFNAAQDTGEEFKSHVAPDHLHRLAKYLKEDDGTQTLNFQFKNAEGYWRWFEIQIIESGGYDAESMQYKCILRDVTSVIQSQGKLEKAKLEADLANKSRSEFLANMSHELRTPLNAILGFAQMIESGTYGDVGHPKYHDYIGSIQESGTTLLSKSNDLLEIANIDSGRMELRESSTDLLGIIRHAIEFHSHRAFSAQITLRHNSTDGPLLVVVDRIRMLQAITNLLSNAIKYNKPGGVVNLACETRRDGGVNIVIEDTGGGILPTHLQNILTAFRQDNSFFARSRDCVGLGLALSKEIVKLHQGRIEIVSEPGKGTLLTIRLPRERTVKRTTPKKIESNVVLSVN